MPRPRALLEGQAELPGVYTLLKFCATWLSAWSGVPAGVFAPSLAIGAGIGHDVALFTRVGPEAAIPLIAMGMAGFLAATTRGPITAFIIVMEMVSGQAMVLSLMACALLSSGVARLITRPMYQELAALLLPAAHRRLPPRPRPPKGETHEALAARLLHRACAGSASGSARRPGRRTHASACRRPGAAPPADARRPGPARRW